MTYRALLLGISEYVHAPLKLEVTENDLDTLEAAFTTAGYKTVERHSCAKGAMLTSAELRHLIEDFLAEAQTQDVSIVYYSGHGFEIDGRHKLLPRDYRPRRHIDNKTFPVFREDLDAMVDDQGLYGLARISPGASAIFFIDACRTGYEFAVTKCPLSR